MSGRRRAVGISKSDKLAEDRQRDWAFFVDDGAAMIVASTIVPVAAFSPFAARCRCTSSNRLRPTPSSRGAGRGRGCMHCAHIDPTHGGLYAVGNRWRSTILPLDILPSVCPHDCPSACALEVERIDGNRIGRVHGARGAELHGGCRLRQGRALCRAPASPGPPVAAAAPDRRQRRGPRRVRADLVGRSARRRSPKRLTRAAQRHGARDGVALLLRRHDGLVQRDGINRLRHAMRYSREDLDDLQRARPTPAGSPGWASSAASTGAKSPSPT